VRLAAGHFPDDFEHAACEPIDGAFGLIASSTLEHRSPPFVHWRARCGHGRRFLGAMADTGRRYPHPRL